MQGMEGDSVQLSRVVAPHGVCRRTVCRKQGFDNGRLAFISHCSYNQYLCVPLPAGVHGDSVVLGVLHAALLPGPAHLVELLPDPPRSCQSGCGESRAAPSFFLLLQPSDLLAPIHTLQNTERLSQPHFVKAGLFP